MISLIVGLIGEFDIDIEQPENDSKLLDRPNIKLPYKILPYYYESRAAIDSIFALIS
jgi:hypothetical protein